MYSQTYAGPHLRRSEEEISADVRARMARARILLADDHPEILKHAARMLEATYDVVGLVTEGDAVYEQVAKLNPDLVVLDISMGNRSGIEIAEHILKQGYPGQIVFLTVHEDAEFVAAAVGLGARGYVIKSRMSVDLTVAIAAVLAQQTFVSPISG